MNPNCQTFRQLLYSPSENGFLVSFFFFSEFDNLLLNSGTAGNNKSRNWKAKTDIYLGFDITIALVNTKHSSISRPWPIESDVYKIFDYVSSF